MTDKNKKHQQELPATPRGSSQEREALLAQLAEKYTNGFLREATARGLLPEMRPEHTNAAIEALGKQARILAQEEGDVSDRRRFAETIDPSLSEEERIRAELHKKATYDPLTDVLNKYGLEEFLESVHAPQALLYIDLTNFKKVNDTINHARGDQVLVGVADTLTKAVRSHDVVARVGGDEFVVVLSDDDKNVEQEEGGDRKKDPASSEETAQEALKIVKGRIVGEILAYLKRNPDVESLGFTAAVGDIIWKQGDTFADLLHKAEVNMYAAKAEQHEEYGKYR